MNLAHTLRHCFTKSLRLAVVSGIALSIAHFFNLDKLSQLLTISTTAGIGLTILSLILMIRLYTVGRAELSRFQNTIKTMSQTELVDYCKQLEGERAHDASLKDEFYYSLFLGRINKQRLGVLLYNKKYVTNYMKCVIEA